MSKLSKPISINHSPQRSTPKSATQNHTPIQTVLQRAKVNPQSLSPHMILQLQKTIGNQGVQHLLQQSVAQRKGDDEHDHELKTGEKENKANKNYKETTQRHYKNQEELFNLVYGNKGVDDQDTILKNSLQWIKAEKVKIYALTVTHDAPARAKTLNRKGDFAYVGYPDDSVGPSLDYNDSPYHQTYTTVDEASKNVRCEPPTTLGFATDSNSIAIVEPAKNKHLIPETIKHEIQHIADGHFNNVKKLKEELLDMNLTTEKRDRIHQDLLLESYFSEQRAYSVEAYKNPTEIAFDLDKRFGPYKKLYPYVKQILEYNKKSKNNNDYFEARKTAYTKFPSKNPSNSYQLFVFYKYLEKLLKNPPQFEDQVDLRTVENLETHDAIIASKHFSMEFEHRLNSVNPYIVHALKTKLADKSNNQAPSPLSGEDALAVRRFFHQCSTISYGKYENDPDVKKLLEFISGMDQADALTIHNSPLLEKILISKHVNKYVQKAIYTELAKKTNIPLPINLASLHDTKDSLTYRLFEDAFTGLPFKKRIEELCEKLTKDEASAVLSADFFVQAKKVATFKSKMKTITLEDCNMQDLIYYYDSIDYFDHDEEDIKKLSVVIKQHRAQIKNYIDEMKGEGISLNMYQNFALSHDFMDKINSKLLEIASQTQE